MRIINSGIVTAFSAKTIGTKVLNVEAFNAEMHRLVGEFDFPTGEGDGVKGRGRIVAPSLAPLVSSGDAPRTGSYVADSPMAYGFVRRVADGDLSADEIRQLAGISIGQAERALPVEIPAGYVRRVHRDNKLLFLGRSHEQQPPAFCALIVYTVEAYLADGDIREIPGEADYVRQEADNDATHVLVAILGSHGPKPTRSPFRFLANCAGEDGEHLQATAEQLQTEAKDILEYTAAWVTVAD